MQWKEKYIFLVSSFQVTIRGITLMAILLRVASLWRQAGSLHTSMKQSGNHRHKLPVGGDYKNKNGCMDI